MLLRHLFTGTLTCKKKINKTFYFFLILFLLSVKSTHSHEQQQWNRMASHCDRVVVPVQETSPNFTVKMKLGWWASPSAFSSTYTGRFPHLMPYSCRIWMGVLLAILFCGGSGLFGLLIWGWRKKALLLELLQPPDVNSNPTLRHLERLHCLACSCINTISLPLFFLDVFQEELFVLFARKKNNVNNSHNSTQPFQRCVVRNF